MVNPTRKPHPDEYADFCASYVTAVEGPLLERLEGESEEWGDLLAAVPPDQEGYRYAPGKWSIREVVGHVIDAERMFCVRAMAFARGDASRYPSFDENAYPGFLKPIERHRPPGAVKFMWAINLTATTPEDRCRHSVSRFPSHFKSAGAAG